ncbi:Ubiquitin carboxyl-terminal hydrolase isozyme L3 [Allomyces arbusculus]|nr:Ubiquitin carboxyl-terminal hydrolase isozyme L3 [Allomyces arbusculus]
MAEKTAWVPLESNPETDLQNLFTCKFVTKLGVPQDWAFCDVFGLDPELLAMVPPAIAVILLFPITEKYEAYRKSEDQRLLASPPTVPGSAYFLKQTIGNACGTIAVLHSVLNNADLLPLAGTPLGQILTTTKTMTPQERANALEHNTALAQLGQTAAPSADADVDLHFVAFVGVEGQLLELDGRRPFPIPHGPLGDQSLLENVARVVREFIQRDPDNLQFNLIALAQAE